MIDNFGIIQKNMSCFVHKYKSYSKRLYVRLGSYGGGFVRFHVQIFIQKIVEKHL